MVIQMNHNFWYWLLTNLIGFIYGFMVGAGILPPHQQWGLAAAVTGYGAELFYLSFVFLGTFIRLKTLAFILGLLFLMELWRNKGKIFNIVAILRFFL